MNWFGSAEAEEGEEVPSGDLDHENIPIEEGDTPPASASASSASASASAAAAAAYEPLDTAPGAAMVSYNDDSTKACTLTLKNNSQSIVQLTWVNFSGEEQVYNAVHSGSETTQDTYSTHVWRLVDEEGGLLLQYRGPSAILEIPPSGTGASVTVVSE